MTKLVDLSQVRSAWAHRYGSARATAMLAGSRGPVAAYDSRYGIRRYGRDGAPDDSDMGGGASGSGDDPDSRMEAIKTFLKNRLDPESWSTLCQMMESAGGGPAGNGPTTSRQPDPSDDPDNYSDSDSNSAQPPAFAGRPSPGGQMEKGGRDRRYGQDAHPRGYFDAFPANSRIIVES